MRASRLTLVLASFLVGGLAFATYTTVQEHVVEVADQHKMIAKGQGEWAGTMTMYNPMMPEPMKAPCTEIVTNVGELWNVTRFEMEFMGQPFEGAATLGWDPDKKKFVGSWIDSFTPHLTVMEGDWDEAKNAIVMHYESKGPMGDMRKMRSETVHGEDVFHVKFFDVTDAEEFLQMEMEMNRKAKAAINAGASR